MHFSLTSMKGQFKRRAVALLVTSLLIVSMIPASAQGAGQGYLVFRGSQPVGPDLDVVFHAVLPEGVEVLSADLHLYGSAGVVPVSASTSVAGVHNHSVSTEGAHSHVIDPGLDHNHSVTPSSAHDHPMFVYGTVFSTDAGKMNVSLPGHDHTFDGATRVVDPYNFAPVVSNGHDHTSQPHGHTTLITLSAKHNHTTDGGGDHNHSVEVVPDHSHTADMVGEHGHDLTPGWSLDTVGSRPSGVVVSLGTGSGPEVLPTIDGDAGADWNQMVDVSGKLNPEVTDVRITSATPGTIEYVLVVEVDEPYAVLAGQSSIGPGAPVDVPLWGAAGAVSAQTYLFGADLPVPVSMTALEGDHTHTATAEDDHTHDLDLAGNHTHVVTGGAHEHNGTVDPASPDTTETTPTWSLPAHQHSVTWAGQTVTDVGDQYYGTQLSNDHIHSVVSHDHTVTLDVSGDHDHDLKDAGTHVHTATPVDTHTHGTSQAGDHGHGVAFSPASSSSGGPAGVTASLDGSDITSAHGGPWTLAAAPITLDLEPSDWSGVHWLNLTSTTDAEVEWVVLIELAAPVVLVSANSLAGEPVVHFPVTGAVGVAQAIVAASPYVMPVLPTTVEVAAHDHVSSDDGAHSHGTQLSGGHSHELADGTHSHDVSLEDAVVNASEANGTVDLTQHTHTIPLGSQFTTQNSIVTTTGTHSHGTEPHNHTLAWDTTGEHTHLGDFSGDHIHDLDINGSHTHTLAGGEHTHTLSSGLHTDSGYTSPSSVTLKVGAAALGTTFTGTGARWWDEQDLAPEDLEEGAMNLLSLTVDDLGTVFVVIRVLIDAEPPELALVSAPDWVRTGVEFEVVVAIPADVDLPSVALEAGPISVLDGKYDIDNMTMTFICVVPPGTADGVYALNVSASDTVGNFVTVTLGTVSFDGTSPSLSLDVGEPLVRDQSGSFIWVTSMTPIRIGIDDGLSGPGAVEYSFSPDGPWTAYDPEDPYILDGAGLSGRATLHYRGNDIAGNPSGSSTVELAIDDDAPVMEVIVEPSVEGANPGEFFVGPESWIFIQADDGDGIGVHMTRYRIIGTDQSPDWRTYDSPLLAAFISPNTEPFTIQWMAEDGIGNLNEGATNSLAVTFDVNYPVPSPPGDLFFPEATKEADISVGGHIPGEVSSLHYRLDTGDAGSVDVDPDTTFYFDIHPEPGVNVILYALEDRVGNISPWVVAGTITLDNQAPQLVGLDPDNEFAVLLWDGFSIGMHFSEPVTVVVVEFLADVEPIDHTLLVHEDNMSASLVIVKLPSFHDDTIYEVTAIIRLTDLAGNTAEYPFSYNMEEDAGEAESRNNFIYGIIAGLVIGMLVAFVVLSMRRRGPTVLPDPDAHPSREIISPEPSREWDFEEESSEDHEGYEEEEDSEYSEAEDVGAEDEPPDEETDYEGETEPDAEPESEEDEEPAEIADEVEPAEDQEWEADEEDEEDTDDLLDDIDKLLEDSGLDDEEPGTGTEDGASSTKIDDLPDPHEATVDPGARF